MNTTEKFTHVTVLGAAGKMGSGILLLNAIYMAELAFKKENRNKVFILNAIDVDNQMLNNLLPYLRGQLLKHGEKNINQLRAFYSDRNDLIENSEIIPAFVNDVLGMVRLSTNIEVAYNSHLVFEAVTEKLDVKAGLLNKIKTNSTVDPWFLTNTSSIPIQIIDEKAVLSGQIIGCHFYNPPAVQKLIEVIQFPNGNKDMAILINEMAKSLGKIIVPANDIAGFIGNGVFIREINLALQLLDQLMQTYPLEKAVGIINHVSQDLLLRPMGIFQLIDYVGIDVCHFITTIMDTHLPDNFNDTKLQVMLDAEVKGGQNSNGSQKDGFFSYEKGRIAKVYQASTKSYIPVSEIEADVMAYLGEHPTELNWKRLVRDRSKGEKLANHFNLLRQAKTQGALLAVNYLNEMKNIGQRILDTEVSNNAEDVNKVMITGFHQLYGPINNY